jgi:hypothetical protein
MFPPRQESGSTGLFIGNRLSVLFQQAAPKAPKASFALSSLAEVSKCTCSTWNTGKRYISIDRLLTFHVEQIAREETKSSRTSVSKEIKA